MSDLHRARARAETFAHAVDHGPRHSSRLSDDPELMEAVELVGRLRTAGAVAPRPEFSAELRHRLLEQAAARAATTTPTVVRSTPDGSDDPPTREDVDASVTDIRHRHGRRIRLVASTAALVLLGGGIGSAAAAQQAMPGDTLVRDEAQHRERRDQRRGRGRLPRPARSRARDDPAVRSPRAGRVNGGDVATINSTLDTSRGRPARASPGWSRRTSRTATPVRSRRSRRSSPAPARLSVSSRRNCHRNR